MTLKLLLEWTDALL